MKTYKFTEEEVKLMWSMIDVALKAGGMQNLDACNTIVRAMQRPIREKLGKNNQDTQPESE